MLNQSAGGGDEPLVVEQPIGQLSQLGPAVGPAIDGDRSSFSQGDRMLVSLVEVLSNERATERGSLRIQVVTDDEQRTVEARNHEYRQHTGDGAEPQLALKLIEPSVDADKHAHGYDFSSPGGSSPWAVSSPPSKASITDDSTSCGDSGAVAAWSAGPAA